MDEKVLLALVLICVLLFLLFVGPVFTIWSLNTLFALEIPINFKTWCAVMWLTAVLHGIKLSFNKE